MKIGVVIGRFQVPELSPGHKWLLDYVSARSDLQIVFVGCSGLYGLRRNPLDYSSRETMICDYLCDVSDPHNATVLPLQDMNSDEEWSKQVDSIIQTVFPMATEVVLYHGRDSFAPHYKGKHKLEEIGSYSSSSGSDIRASIAKTYLKTTEERRGAIWARQHTFPGVKMAVDVALINPGRNATVCLGRKRGSTLWQFPGGFVDPADESLEAAARREGREETGLTGVDLRYVGSHKVDDWRLRGEPDYGITTALFAGHCDGLVAAADDLEEVMWADWEDADLPSVMAPSHKPLLKMFVDYMGDLTHV